MLLVYLCRYFVAGGRGIHRPLDVKKRKADAPTHSGAEFKSKVRLSVSTALLKLVFAQI